MNYRKLFEQSQLALENKVFYRLPGHVINNELYVVNKALTSLVASQKNGNDFDLAAMNDIIKKLKAITAEAKLFHPGDKIPVAYDYKDKKESVDEAVTLQDQCNTVESELEEAAKQIVFYASFQHTSNSKRYLEGAKKWASSALKGIDKLKGLSEETESPLLESVKIAPLKGYGKSIPAPIKDALQKIIDSAKAKSKSITNPAFFDSGYYGVSFNIDNVEYVIGVQDTRMTKDDGILMGNIFLQKTGDKNKIAYVVATDRYDAEFPSDQDIAKILKALNHLLR